MRFTFHKIHYILTQYLRKTLGGNICFSIEVEKNINKLSDYFKASQAPAKQAEFDRLLMLQAEMDSQEFDQSLGLKHSNKKRSTIFKIPANDGRIFSNYFANVVMEENSKRIIHPMRYRIRPHDSSAEIPTKFNVFNARIDSLESRKTWKPLFMKNHGIIPFKKFYEWVPGENKKPKLIAFYPDQREMMWAPCLWDEWISKDGRIYFKSFAIITDEPPAEIKRMGHDRCPIFLKEANIDSWLRPQNGKNEEIYSLLQEREEVEYQHVWV